MYRSRKFTTIPTRDTRERLHLAGTSAQPITQGESHRGSVVALQTILSELNQTYLLGAEIDGYFGPRTFNAVELFQRDYGLVADGIAGKQTLAQLDTLFSPDVIRLPVGMSVHVGLDHVDPDHYGGDMALPSCANDARAMRDIAVAIGYDSLLLVNETATTGNFTAFMRSGAEKLYAGDCLFVTFSGHGGQVPNESGGDTESDLRDETMCLYDRMLIDDEMYSLLSLFREGVRVHIVFDSCHSGTAAKRLTFTSDKYPKERKNIYSKGISSSISKSVPFTGTQLSPDADGNLVVKDADISTSTVPITKDSLSDALAGAKPELVSIPPASADVTRDLAELFSDLFINLIFGPPKFLEDFGFVYQENKTLYDAVASSVGLNRNILPICTVTTLSACEDVQTTSAGNPYSLFTYNIMQTWDSGNFVGSYSQFHKQLQARSRDDATPVLNGYGSAGPTARFHERPFMY